MTAVASPPSYPAGLSSRNGWPASNNGSAINLNAMSQEDVSRMLVPRKSAQRSNSSSSLSSNASSASTISVNTPSSNSSIAGEIPTRRKSTRGLWPSPAKSEPVSGVTAARSTSVPAAASGPSAASAISALHTPHINGQNASNGHAQVNGVSRAQSPSDAPAMLHLMPMNGTFERKTITVPFNPDVLRIGRQTNAKTVPTPMNGFFDSKVLSRQHAEVWAERDGKIFVRDVKSSNGTFVNGKRLSQENRDSEPHLLKENDILELGIDIISEDQKTVVHHKVAARVEHAGLMGVAPPPPEVELEGYGMRGRAGTNANRSQQNLSAAAYHAKWLQPITLEQIAKRLKVCSAAYKACSHESLLTPKMQTELRQAKLQSQDLQSTRAFVDAVAHHGNPPPPPLPNIPSPTKPNDVKARFSSQPPAPPPSQPLPEKPDAPARSKFSDLPGIQPLLRRSETEKPRILNGSPISPEAAPSISSLLNALSVAKDEINSQAEKVRQLEESLHQEREARASAEERIKLTSGGMLSRSVEETVTEDTDPRTSPLQRIELMRMEMEDMKTQMESFKQRAETAETERKSLAQMIEDIRQRDAAASSDKKSSWSLRGKKKGNVQMADATTQEAEDAGCEADGSTDDLEEAVDAVLKNHLVRQRTLKPEGETESGISDEQIKTAVAEVTRAFRNRDMAVVQKSRRHDQLAQTAPYASILGVVLIGVGLMSYLNGWQKVTDR